MYFLYPDSRPKPATPSSNLTTILVRNALVRVLPNLCNEHTIRVGEKFKRRKRPCFNKSPTAKTPNIKGNSIFAFPLPFTNGPAVLSVLGPKG